MPTESRDWTNVSFSEWCAVMREDEPDTDDGHWLAVLVMVEAETEAKGYKRGPGGYPVERWIREAPALTRGLALKSLTAWAAGLPSMDPPADGEVLPVTDEEYLAWYREYGASDAETNAEREAEAVQEIEKHRAAARAAIEMIRRGET